MTEIRQAGEQITPEQVAATAERFRQVGGVYEVVAARLESDHQEKLEASHIDADIQPVIDWSDSIEARLDSATKAQLLAMAKGVL